MTSPRAEPLRTGFASLLVVAVAVGYLLLDFWGKNLPAAVPGDVPPVAHAGLVVLQAAALLWWRRWPIVVFAVVVVADLVILATTAGELGIGALAVMLASYSVARRGARTARLVALTAGAAATTIVGSLAGAVGVAGVGQGLAVLIVTAVARVALLYVAPATVAEYLRGRSLLRDSLQAQARMAENERRESAERRIRADRAALARELHDVAGHHLSGIIVGAQAATALIQSDPERASTMLRTVQDDARIALSDLRRTVGLLRDDGEPDLTGQPSAVPTMAGITLLVAAAAERGHDVHLTSAGDIRALGPLAETAGYRMVQESLANAARHAPGSRCDVSVTWAATVDVTVRNGPGQERTAAAQGSARSGYGLAGMAERAELVGAELTTGPTADGGWCNTMTLPIDERPSS